MNWSRASGFANDACLDSDWPTERVVAVLGQDTNTEDDNDGNIVGYGLILHETLHALEIDGRRQYAWCALDALMFPALIRQTARVSSHCAAIGAPVSLTEPLARSRS